MNWGAELAQVVLPRLVRWPGENVLATAAQWIHKQGVAPQDLEVFDLLL